MSATLEPKTKRTIQERTKDAAREASNQISSLAVGMTGKRQKMLQIYEASKSGVQDHSKL